MGIRYFDFRVSRTSKSEEIRIVHGLYGEEVVSLVLEFLEFLAEHPKEVVFLDFNHFYNFDKEAHSTLIGALTSLFDSKFCPHATDIGSLNLKYLWEKGYQVVLFYRPEDCQVPIPNEFWSKDTISSPWPDTDNCKTLIKCLEESLTHRMLPANSFFVTQGIITPRTVDILKHSCSSLEKDLAIPTTSAVTQWIRNFERRSLMNIVICDFIDIMEFVQVVVSINYR